MRRLTTDATRKRIEQLCPLGRMATIDEVATARSSSVRTRRPSSRASRSWSMAASGFDRAVRWPLTDDAAGAFPSIRQSGRSRSRRQTSLTYGVSGCSPTTFAILARADTSFACGSDGTVRVTIPRWGSKREAVAFAEQQRSWIDKQLARLRAERAEPREQLSAGRSPRVAVAREARTARSPAASGGAVWFACVASERQESAVALGILLPQRSYLPQLAAGDDARLGARLCDRSRVDALETSRSFSEILEARGRGVPAVSGSPRVAAGSRRG